ncbi:MAG: hypothetical protein L3J95_04420 [Thermoplasmata archaeon]|nr:hypothetical protein [Thermoplasmata archaeon]MCI4359650.1 hypothetical protein [Thermoplasmata archaeon]
MSRVAAPRTQADRLGRHRLALGGAFGLIGALIGIVLPVGLLLETAYAPGGPSPLGGPQLTLLALILTAGLLLLVVSFVMYRSAFAALRTAEPKFWVASALCLIGTVGLIVVLVASVAVGGSVGEVARCAHGSPSHALACLRAGSSGEVLGASLAVLGFWLAWVGGVGIVIGLGLEGRRIRKPALVAGAAAYALVLLAFIGPFAALLLSLPSTGPLWIALSVLALVAPGLVLRGSQRS